MSGVWDDRGFPREAEPLVWSFKAPFHLLLALARTQAVESVVLGQTIRCGKDYAFLQPVYRELARSAGQAQVQATALAADTACGQELGELFAKKGTAEPATTQSAAPLPATPLQAAARALQRLIFLLVNAAVFFAAAAVSLAALELKQWNGLMPGQGKWKVVGEARKYGWLGALALAASAGLAMLVLLVGFQAGVPVTYHGGSGQGLTMASNFWPQVFGEGHSLALAAALAGTLAAFLGGRHRFSFKALAGVAVVGLFLLALPQTSYAVKRNALSLACADCVMDETGESLSVALAKIVAPMSQGKAWQLLAASTEPQAKKFFEEIDRLRYQGRREEALALLREFALRNQGRDSEAEALYRIGAISQSMGRSREAVNGFALAARRFPAHANAAAALYNAGTIAFSLKEYGEAVEALERLTKDYAGSPFRPAGLYYLALAYSASGQRDRAGQALGELIEKYPDHSMAEAAKSQQGLIG